MAKRTEDQMHLQNNKVVTDTKKALQALQKAQESAEAAEKESVIIEKGYKSDVQNIQIRLEAILRLCGVLEGPQKEDGCVRVLRAIEFFVTAVDQYLKKDIIRRAKNPILWKTTTHRKINEFCCILQSYEADLRNRFRDAESQAKIKELTSEVNDFKIQIKQYEDQIKKYQENNEKYQQQIEQLKTKSKESEAQINKYQEQNKRLEEKVLEESAKSTERDKRVNVLEDQMAQMMSNFNQCAPSTSQDN